jgi:putative membrane protein
MSDNRPFRQVPEDRRIALSRFLLVSSYAAGIVGIGLLNWPLFLQLTPFNLILSFGILYWNHIPADKRWWIFVTVAWATGYLVEVAGVSTGRLFGNYAYGNVLGWKVLETPLLIGINWAMLVYVGCDAVNRWVPDAWSNPARIAISASLPVALDVCIEPVAIHTGMWHWFGSDPPLQNYVGWYVVSMFLSIVYHKTIGREHRNAVAPLLLLMQVVFFVAILLLMR